MQFVSKNPKSWPEHRNVLKNSVWSEFEETALKYYLIANSKQEPFDAKLGDCFIWQGDKGTYGKVSFHKRIHNSHRLSYILFVGPIPDGYNILHICDKPLCIAPLHLKAGTQKENISDCIAKGRFKYIKGTKKEKEINQKKEK